jgi:hypothetical protein
MQAITRSPKIRVDLSKYKRVRGCKVCGFNAYSCALQFHHEDPSEKLFNISDRRGIDSVAEMSKCSVLCAKCHAIDHWGKIQDDDDMDDDEESSTWRFIPSDGKPKEGIHSIRFLMKTKREKYWRNTMLPRMFLTS